MRKDQYDVTLAIDGQNLGTFDNMTGGQTDSDDLKYHTGGMGPVVSLGGNVTVDQVVIQRLYTLERDHVSIQWLLGRVGRGHCVLKKQPLDVDGNAFGKPLVYTGVLKRVLPPEVDAQTTDAALLEVELTPEGRVT